MQQTPVTIRLAHSPDSDDAFMFYALATGKLDTGRLRFEFVRADVESLNQQAAQNAPLDITALSVHAYAYSAAHYSITIAGASFGGADWGPIVVTRDTPSRDELRRRTIAIPGTMTSAYLGLRLALGDFPFVVAPFDTIMEGVAQGAYDAGLLIHEGQLTHTDLGLHQMLNIGEWWHEQTGGLPLPLGVNAIRRDLPQDVRAAAARLTRDSIAYGLAHRDDALDYAMQFGRGLQRATVDAYIDMYVNDLTVDMGERGQQSIRLFLQKAHEAGILQEAVPVDFV
jgi:1,4-dihydroxy-6-naphthoate synthase